MGWAFRPYTNPRCACASRVNYIMPCIDSSEPVLMCTKYFFTLSGSPEANLFVYYLSDNMIQLKSANPEKECYLVFEDGEFRAGKADDKNSIFEVVGQDERGSVGQVALRPVTATDCYLGFSNPESEPACYPSTELAATRLGIFQ
ncbi:hypothetical protein GBAR_LOCUS638 [Geodia barretti]|uniref:Uncharacterized protein n=1 Tax=Geodia barretti TaxID=519541 RepID=A0AA35QTJ8_GEOBA|nr:hypothetical protein GBAR_LOCUS638 [Geodia barretti]